MMAHDRLHSTRGPQVILYVALVALSGAAWLTLWLWGQSSAARFLHHASTASAGAGTAEGVLFVTGWAVMIVAMMMPTSVPLVMTFGGMVARRSNGTRLVALVIAGYLVVWTAFGAALYLGDRGLHLLVDAWPWLASHAYLISASTLALAGAYQFSALKYSCLDECRSPIGFIVSRWQARHVRWEAFRLGIAHGLFCVGCCWSLMLVMFAVGLGSLAWMFVLALVMAVEKNHPVGRRLSRPLGVVLLLAAVYAVAAVAA